MMKRITVSRDGTVRLRGRPTRWRVMLIPWREGLQSRMGAKYAAMAPGDGCKPPMASKPLDTQAEVRTYLESLTDEELLG